MKPRPSLPRARTRQLAHCRPDEVLAERRCTGLLWLPLGPLEWHGPHLPLGVDPFNAEATALACAGRLGGLVLPTLFSGTERERPAEMLGHLGFSRRAYVVGMDFPKHSLRSGYFPEEEFALQVRGWIARARDWGFRTMVLVNGHGARNHNMTLRRLVEEARRPGAKVRLLAYLALVTDPRGSLNIGHASADETSLMLLDHPADVRLAALPCVPHRLRGADFGIVDDATFRGDPRADRTLRDEDDPRRHAARERGRALRARTVAFICREVAACLRDPSHPRANLADDGLS